MDTYEKKYNEALERARKDYNSHLEHLYDGYRKNLEEIFPELAESEDERIRKEIYNFLIDMECKKEWIAYMEKQKEQPTNEEMLRTLRAEYEKGVADTIAKYEQKEQKPEGIYVDCTEHPEWYGMPAKEQKPAEWSEWEYGRLFDIEHYLEGTLQLSPDRKIACIDFLKSLRPSWKPSKEQMEALKDAVKLYKETHFERFHDRIVSLYEQLKKLL